MTVDLLLNMSLGERDGNGVKEKESEWEYGEMSIWRALWCGD